MDNPKTNIDMTGGEALVSALISAGTDTLFAIPGIQLDWAVDALAARSEISVYVPRHEQSITYMADGFARVTGQPGVGMAVPGPGMLNATAGLSTAYACNSPVIFIVGQIHSDAIGKGYGNLHEIPDQSGVLRGLTKSHELVLDHNRISGAIQAAFSAAMNGRKRPASVELPYDLLIEKGEVPAEAQQMPDEPPAPEEKLIEKASELINQASFPVIYIGGGAIDAGAEILALARKLGAPVIASDNGRGAIPDSDPLMFNSLAGRPLFQKADLILVVGSRFMDIMTPEPSWPQNDKTFIYINIDPCDLGGLRHGAVDIVSDAALAAEALTQSVAHREGMNAEQSSRIKAWALSQIHATGTLWEYVSALREALPDDGIFVNELTQVGYLARIAFECRQPRTLIGPGYQGTLGYSFPTALGAAVGGGGRRVFSISGDGGFGWSVQELATARRYNLPVTLVIFNDGLYGNVHAIQNATFGRNYITELANPNFEQLARAFGIDFARASDPGSLKQILSESVKVNGPLLVEAPVGKMAAPWPLLRLRPMGGGQQADYSDLFEKFGE
ncbi:thiamine pyrophosphate-dependent enzyme [Paracoccus aerodenitrificans]|uniref:thiamine pyrophosphate-dependent enzyme n=1 Tax=Paracoccus aerodenitrificans TaxID=3017781 RepID=UPI0022F0569F|nr:thiamine pyrophosphate-dependent enzyme [Paracoccus aerodenitrificans]WBU63568.1 thiamine pyrophosphate-binding protein [Paracoccus aerodenitrificans]